jgi:hypothetical protein
MICTRLGKGEACPNPAVKFYHMRFSSLLLAACEEHSNYPPGGFTEIPEAEYLEIKNFQEKLRR